jgi:ceramide glucosyltransferase
LIVLLAVVSASAIYLALALTQIVRFARRRVPARKSTPSVTILKPLYGSEPWLYESLVTFCDQDYPDFEIVFCLHERDDPATPIVERVKAEFPERRIRIVYGDNANMANPKIANLAKPGAEPAGDIIILADSDIWVDRDYVDAIVASFTTDRTGAVSCLYGGVPNASLASRLGAMHSEEEFGPSVLVAIFISKMTRRWAPTSPTITRSENSSPTGVSRSSSPATWCTPRFRTRRSPSSGRTSCAGREPISV